MYIIDFFALPLVILIAVPLHIGYLSDFGAPGWNCGSAVQEPSRFQVTLIAIGLNESTIIGWCRVYALHTLLQTKIKMNVNTVFKVTNVSCRNISMILCSYLTY